LIKQSSQSSQREKSLPSIRFKNLTNATETARARDLSTINTSIHTDKSKTIRNFNLVKNNSNRSTKSQMRKISILDMDTLEAQREKEEIKLAIENTVQTKLKENEDLHIVFDKVIGKDDVKNTIIDYYLRQGKDKAAMEEYYNKYDCDP
jgi:hypothetical protein